MNDTGTIAAEIPVSQEPSARLIQWQRITLILLIVGYAGYYICRSNLSVATPLLIRVWRAGAEQKGYWSHRFLGNSRLRFWQVCRRFTF